MPLASGTRLGHDDIVDTLGTGGMGEVSRALHRGRRSRARVRTEAFRTAVGS